MQFFNIKHSLLYLSNIFLMNFLVRNVYIFFMQFEVSMILLLNFFETITILYFHDFYYFDIYYLVKMYAFK